MTAKKAKPAAKPVHATVRRLVDPTTGESVKAFVVEHLIDRRLLNDRKLRVGDEVRLEIKKRRNVGFFRKIHSLAGFLREHIDGFEDCPSDHDAIKRLQRESGVCCEVQEIDLGTLGKVQVKVAESLCFDDMPEERFNVLYDGLLNYAITKYRPEMSRDQFESLMNFAEVSA